ncbi:MAG: hypothetical protein AB1650_01635 [Candidatus Omnitrophota bacterium]
MPYKLTTDQINKLISQPETGMGYQYVEAKMSNYSSFKGVVLNGEVFIPDIRVEKIMGFRSLNYSAILNEAEQAGQVRDLKVISKGQLHLGEKFFAKSAKAPASEAPITETKEDEVFKRYSPYRNDRRVTSDGGLLPGTYTTTEEDSHNVKTGKEAMDRYALPSDDPAIYVFTIQPPEKTRVRVGIVEPANNKPGGGVEVIFEDGSPRKTVTGLDTIPAE